MYERADYSKPRQGTDLLEVDNHASEVCRAADLVARGKAEDEVAETEVLQEEREQQLLRGRRVLHRAGKWEGRSGEMRTKLGLLAGGGDARTRSARE